MADDFKRNIAFKFRLGTLIQGKPIFDEQTQRFHCLELGDKKIVRVNIIGNIVDKYESEGEKKYIFLTLDDGSGQIKLKTFGDDAQKFKEVNTGQTVIVIGVMRNFNNETYIAPEIIKEQDPKYLVIRKLELEKNQSENATPVENKTQVIAIKDKILEQIKNAEAEGGIDVDKIILTLKDTSPEVINTEIKNLIGDGIVFEPRPGKLRYLG
ncbi:hypothetical protein HN832_01200 [archaeon]|jgi:RPA family protein|nr:hypothetical protein [archaeon]MBT4373889.1 hypothetical protein [archaeon]MBT4532166.1 hypothetical protein [archaeon]MBT7001119.1 hypothetical protein [archaeon]MBT7282008.1 hypothetical protein [archaeon]